MSKFGSNTVVGQRFCACFVLKFALQRGEGEKRGVKISKQGTQNLRPRKYLEPCMVRISSRGGHSSCRQKYVGVEGPALFAAARCCLRARAHSGEILHLGDMAMFRSSKYRAPGVSWVKCSVCFILKFAFSPFSPPHLWSANFKIKHAQKL